MATSQQTQQMFAMQNQQFMAMQQYSQQISQMQNRGGLGAYGGIPDMGEMLRPNIGGREYGPFTYGMPAMMGYGPGSEFGARMTSGITGFAPTALTMGGAVAGGLTLAGTVGLVGQRTASIAGGIGSVIDPFQGGITGALAGKGVMGRIGGAMLGAAPGLAIYAGVSHVAGSMAEGAQEQSAINAVLGRNFNFTNPTARGGRGFSRQDAMAIGNMVRQIQSIPEMLTSTDELTRVMDKLASSGALMSRDAGEFQTKFKAAITTIRDVAKIMGTTMEGATQLFTQARQQGFYSATDIVKNAVQTQVTSAITGMNEQQVAMLKAQGAQLSYAMGGRRGEGASGIERTAQRFGMAKRLGVLKEEDVLEYSGVGGAAGINIMAQEFQQTAHRMARGTIGTALAISLAQKVGNRFTGRMDEQAVQNFLLGGGMTARQLLGKTRQQVRGRGSKISYMAHRQALRANMVNQLGPEGIALAIRSAIGSRFSRMGDEEVQNLIMQRFGMSERQAEIYGKMAKDAQKLRESIILNMGQETNRIVEQNYIAQNLSWEAIKRKMSKRLENVVTEPFKQAGAELSNYFSQGWENFMDRLTGRYSYEITKGASDTVRDAVRGSAEARSKMIQSVSGLRGADISQSSVGAFVHRLAGNRTYGMNVNWLAEQMEREGGAVPGGGPLGTSRYSSYSRIGVRPDDVLVAQGIETPGGEQNRFMNPRHLQNIISDITKVDESALTRQEKATTDLIGREQLDVLIRQAAVAAESPTFKKADPVERQRLMLDRLYTANVHTRGDRHFQDVIKEVFKGNELKFNVMLSKLAERKGFGNLGLDISGVSFGSFGLQTASARMKNLEKTITDASKEAAFTQEGGLTAAQTLSIFKGGGRMAEMGQRLAEATRFAEPAAYVRSAFSQMADMTAGEQLNPIMQRHLERQGFDVKEIMGLSKEDRQQLSALARTVGSTSPEIRRALQDLPTAALGVATKELFGHQRGITGRLGELLRGTGSAEAATLAQIESDAMGPTGRGKAARREKESSRLGAEIIQSLRRRGREWGLEDYDRLKLEQLREGTKGGFILDLLGVEEDPSEEYRKNLQRFRGMTRTDRARLAPALRKTDPSLEIGFMREEEAKKTGRAAFRGGRITDVEARAAGGYSIDQMFERMGVKDTTAEFRKEIEQILGGPDKRVKTLDTWNKVSMAIGESAQGGVLMAPRKGAGTTAQSEAQVAASLATLAKGAADLAENLKAAGVISGSN